MVLKFYSCDSSEQDYWCILGGILKKGTTKIIGEKFLNYETFSFGSCTVCGLH